MPSSHPCPARAVRCLVLFLSALLLGLGAPHSQAQAGNPPIPVGDARIHYHRADGNYSGWAMYTFNASTANNSYCSSEVNVAGTDSFGVYFDVPVSATAGSPAGDLGFIINNCALGVKDPGPDQHLQTNTSSEAWVLSGNATVYLTNPTLAQGSGPIPAGDVRIHYFRPDGNCGGWAMYVFGAATSYQSYCSTEINVTGTDAYGIYFDVPVNATYGTPAGNLGFIINNCSLNVKDPGPDQHLQTTQFNEAWVVSGDATVYTTLPTAAQKLNGLFSQQQAYWLDRSRVAIQAAYFKAGDTYSIQWSNSGGLAPGVNGVTGGQAIPLVQGGALTADELTRYPQLASYSVLTVSPSVTVATLENALKGQIALSAVSSSGTLDYATGFQYAGALDDLFYYSGRLGVVVKHVREAASDDPTEAGDAAVRLKLWAPTAQSVR